MKINLKKHAVAIAVLSVVSATYTQAVNFPLTTGDHTFSGEVVLNNDQFINANGTVVNVTSTTPLAFRVDDNYDKTFVNATNKATVNIDTGGLSLKFKKRVADAFNVDDSKLNITGIVNMKFRDSFLKQDKGTTVFNDNVIFKQFNSSSGGKPGSAGSITGGAVVNFKKNLDLTLRNAPSIPEYSGYIGIVVDKSTFNVDGDTMINFDADTGLPNGRQGVLLKAGSDMNLKGNVTYTGSVRSEEANAFNVESGATLNLGSEGTMITMNHKTTGITPPRNFVVGGTINVNASRSDIGITEGRELETFFKDGTGVLNFTRGTHTLGRINGSAGGELRVASGVNLNILGDNWFTKGKGFQTAEGSTVTFNNGHGAYGTANETFNGNVIVDSGNTLRAAEKSVINLFGSNNQINDDVEISDSGVINFGKSGVGNTRINGSLIVDKGTLNLAHGVTLADNSTATITNGGKINVQQDNLAILGRTAVESGGSLNAEHNVTLGILDNAGTVDIKGAANVTGQATLNANSTTKIGNGSSFAKRLTVGENVNLKSADGTVYDPTTPNVTFVKGFTQTGGVVELVGGATFLADSSINTKATGSKFSVGGINTDKENDIAQLGKISFNESEVSVANKAVFKDLDVNKGSKLNLNQASFNGNTNILGSSVVTATGTATTSNKSVIHLQGEGDKLVLNGAGNQLAGDISLSAGSELDVAGEGNVISGAIDSVAKSSLKFTGSTEVTNGGSITSQGTATLANFAVNGGGNATFDGATTLNGTLTAGKADDSAKSTLTFNTNVTVDNEVTAAQNGEINFNQGGTYNSEITADGENSKIKISGNSTIKRAVKAKNKGQIELDSSKGDITFADPRANLTATTEGRVITAGDGQFNLKSVMAIEGGNITLGTADKGKVSVDGIVMSSGTNSEITLAGSSLDLSSSAVSLSAGNGGKINIKNNVTVGGGVNAVSGGVITLDKGATFKELVKANGANAKVVVNGSANFGKSVTAADQGKIEVNTALGEVAKFADQAIANNGGSIQLQGTGSVEAKQLEATQGGNIATSADLTKVTVTGAVSATGDGSSIVLDGKSLDLTNSDVTLTASDKGTINLKQTATVGGAVNATSGGQIIVEKGATFSKAVSVTGEQNGVKSTIDITGTSVFGDIAKAENNGVINVTTATGESANFNGKASATTGGAINLNGSGDVVLNEIEATKAGTITTNDSLNKVTVNGAISSTNKGSVITLAGNNLDLTNKATSITTSDHGVVNLNQNVTVGGAVTANTGGVITADSGATFKSKVTATGEGSKIELSGGDVTFEKAVEATNKGVIDIDKPAGSTATFKDTVTVNTAGKINLTGAGNNQFDKSVTVDGAGSEVTLDGGQSSFKDLVNVANAGKLNLTGDVDFGKALTVDGEGSVVNLNQGNATFGGEVKATGKGEINVATGADKTATFKQAVTSQTGGVININTNNLGNSVFEGDIKAEGAGSAVNIGGNISVGSIDKVTKVDSISGGNINFGNNSKPLNMNATLTSTGAGSKINIAGGDGSHLKVNSDAKDSGQIDINLIGSTSVLEGSLNNHKNDQTSTTTPGVINVNFGEKGVYKPTLVTSIDTLSGKVEDLIVPNKPDTAGDNDGIYIGKLIGDVHIAVDNSSQPNNPKPAPVIIDKLEKTPGSEGKLFFEPVIGADGQPIRNEDGSFLIPDVYLKEKVSDDHFVRDGMLKKEAKVDLVENTNCSLPNGQTTTCYQVKVKDIKVSNGSTGFVLQNWLRSNYSALTEVDSFLDRIQQPAGAWVKTGYDSWKTHSDGNNVKHSLYKLEGGYDAPLNLKGINARVGVYATLATGKTDFSMKNADASNRKAEGGVYASADLGNGVYLASNLGYAGLRSKAENNIITGTQHKKAIKASVESGVQLPINQNWSVTPQLQLQYTHLPSNDFIGTEPTNSDQLDVKVASMDSVITRAGVRVGGAIMLAGVPTNIWAQADLNREWKGDQNYVARDRTTKLNPIALSVENEGYWSAFNFGISTNVTPVLNLGADLGTKFGKKRDAFNCSLKMRYSF